MRLPLSDLVTTRRSLIRRRSVRRTAFPAAMAAAALAIGMTTAAVTGQPAAATGRPAYLNPHLPVQARAADLLVTGLSAPASVSRTGTMTATFTVSNTGSVGGTDIVPVYVHQPVSAVVVPPQRLVGFARVTLSPGQTKTVHVAFRVSQQLAVPPGDIDGTASPQVELGAYQVQIGTPASRAERTVPGPRGRLPARYGPAPDRTAPRYLHIFRGICFSTELWRDATLSVNIFRTFAGEAG